MIGNQKKKLHILFQVEVKIFNISFN